MKWRQNQIYKMVKWFLLSSMIGIVVGMVDAVFLKMLDHTITWRNHFPLYFIGLPFVLYLVYLLARRVSARNADYSTDDVIDKINAYQPVSFISAVKALGLSLLTIGAGGSAGKEAPGADAGAGISSCLAQLFRMSPEDRHKLMICGVSAGFAGVFGVPISGALFGLEVLWVGHIFYEVMFPALIAGITSFQVTTYLGVNYIYHPMHFEPVIAEQFFLKVVVAGVLFGLVAIVFAEILKLMKVVFRYIAVKTSPFWRSFIGGVFLVLVGLFISPMYLGLGMEGFNGVLAGGELASPLGFLIKTLTTAVTFAAGGVGGLITPIFFIGAQAGAAMAGWLGTDPSTMAALGLVAVLAGAANTPLAASIMAIELFGAEIAPYATVACVISFLITGRNSIYPSQRISFDKQSDQQINDPRHGRRMSGRKGLVLKTFKDMSRHLIPNPKGFDNQKDK